MKHWIFDLKSHQHHRCIFYGANVVFWVLGWGSLAVGIWLYTDNSFIALAPSSYSALSSAGLCISVGAMVLIISFVGCIALWIQSKCLLVSYFCFVCLLFMVQCTTGIMGFFYRDGVRHRVKYSLHATINHTYAVSLDYGTEKNPMRITWDHMQSQFQCCGVDSYKDWYFSVQWPKNRFVPDSCCDTSFFTSEKNSMANCGKSESNKHMFYQTGCHELFTDYILQHLYLVALLALLFGFIEGAIMFTFVS
ncbi:tetraspanin family domain-containing protein [Ditylenchus destructor]|nr:tetraspanin family domain-containing protein [Ditylenchus destructor]